jgi:hypothetical protein
MEGKDCEVAWSAGVGVKEVADTQGLYHALCKTNIRETQFFKLMDKLILSHANIFGV